ncbi:MAG TPA: proton-conducting transporter membrane subunit [Bacteroidales bacterium]|nr:proton-conducting transporter membrane subunit [Bacteroidales bacterium]HRT88934.1 proton-conducting transporter membrane subunit [Bacteroidales bacterium]
MSLLLFFISAFIFCIAIFLAGNRKFTIALMALFSLMHISFSIYAWMNRGVTELTYFSYNGPGLLMLFILSVLVIPVVYHGIIYNTKSDIKRFNIYHISLIALITFMSGAYIANNMTVLWIFAEATTLAVAALIYHDRTDVALEATWKYVFVCSVGIALAYLGILFLSFIYGKEDAANLSFETLQGLLKQANPVYLKIAFLFVLVGFSTKMGLFPMHTVTIDAHSVAPPPISALISTTLMNLGYLAIFRVYTLFSSSAIYSFMNNMLIISGTLSLLIAAGYMLKAKHLKRMLAYSSLENMGLVAVATGLGGSGYYGAFLIILLHSLVKSGLFFQMGQLHRVLGTFSLDEAGNYMILYPAGALVLLTGVILILAIPPSGLFIAEFLIIRETVFSNKIFIGITIFLFLCFIIYAMSTRVLHIIYSNPRNQHIPASEGIKVNPAETWTQFVFFAVVIILCIYQPPFVENIIKDSISFLIK